jgi:hypothetical protein
MRIMIARLTYVLAMVGAAGAVQAQDLPKTQPKYLQIIREEVKLGRNADHAKIEAGWPAAFERAKSPNYYLAMVAMTGANEAWFIIPQESHAAVDATMKREEGDRQLTTELDRLQKADADVLNSLRTIQAVARPDLSYGAYPDLSQQRFWEITIFRVRPGHEQQFEGAAKAYVAANKRAAPDQGFRAYEVMLGMPSPTYLVFSSTPSYANFDKMMTDGQAIWGAFTPDEMAVMQKFTNDGLINSETNRFRVSPTMSYVPKAVRQTDPAFWLPKKTMTASTAATTP